MFLKNLVTLPLAFPKPQEDHTGVHSFIPNLHSRKNNHIHVTAKYIKREKNIQTMYNKKDVFL